MAAYGPARSTRSAEIVTLRMLGLSLAQVSRRLGIPQGLEPALASTRRHLEGRIANWPATVKKCANQGQLAQGNSPTAKGTVRLLGPAARFSVAFDLPWPLGWRAVRTSARCGR